MRSRFDKELAQLNSELINMGTLIEEAIQNAVGALVNQDVEQARKAVDFDVDVDQKEKDIENICYKLLLHQQPVAGDLRLITAALKMVSDMERIGDQAADISELTISMAQKPYIKNLEHIRSMAKETRLKVKCLGRTLKIIRSIMRLLNPQKDEKETPIKKTKKRKKMRNVITVKSGVPWPRMVGT